MNTSSCLRKANEPTNCLVCGKDVRRCALFVWREISNPTESLVLDKAKHRSFTYLFQIFPSNHGIRCDQRSGERWGGFTRILCAKESRIFSFAAVCVIDLSYRRAEDIFLNILFASKKLRYPVTVFRSMVFSFQVSVYLTT